jgi:hypothetical protein
MLIYTHQRSKKKKKNTSKKFLELQAEHRKFLASKGVKPVKRGSLRGHSSNWSDLSVKQISASTSNIIPGNGTKSPDMSKAQFAKDNFALVPAYNKGPIQPLTKDDLKSGAGRKL